LYIGKGIAGNIRGSYTYTSWMKGVEEETSFEICSWDNNLKDGDNESSIGHPPTFTGYGSDIADFEIIGSLHGDDQVTWAKLYSDYGWLYSGKLNGDNLSIVGSWGRNMQLWHGTFVLKKEATSTA
jgi:hypothetical protein